MADQAIQYFNIALGWLKSLAVDFWIAFGAGFFLCLVFGHRMRGQGGSTVRRRGRRGGENDFAGDITLFRDVTYKPCQLMSPTEIRFWGLLYQAVPGYHIFPQVAINALVDIESENRNHFRQVLWAFNTFRADFVVCDPELKVRAIVELDDKSHDDRRDKDLKRDYVTKRAGYKTIRFDCRNWPTVESIKKAVLG